jgi:hypothetical protein
LNLPKEDYDAIGIKGSIAMRRQMAKHLQPYIKTLWENPKTNFVVVDDREVRASSDPLEDLDLAKLNRSSSTLPLVLERPPNPSLPAPLVEDQCLLDDGLL